MAVGEATWAADSTPGPICPAAEALAPGQPFMAAVRFRGRARSAVAMRSKTTPQAKLPRTDLMFPAECDTFTADISSGAPAATTTVITAPRTGTGTPTFTRAVMHAGMERHTKRSLTQEESEGESRNRLLGSTQCRADSG